MQVIQHSPSLLLVQTVWDPVFVLQGHGSKTVAEELV